MSELPPPQANPHLFGHERAEAVLLRALAGGRLPHAWLLRGPRGVGKATLAYRFARRLLAGDDHARAATDPANPVFRMVANKAHPDLRVLERTLNPKTGRLAKEILVDQVRQADDALYATAARAGRKVLIVDAADELNLSGANALLKLLEEPPASVVMLLVCQRPGLLPPTILSRCAQLPLAPLPEIELQAGLAALVPALPVERRAALAELAEGSLGRALELDAGAWLDRYVGLLPELAAARRSSAARLALAAKLVQSGDAPGFAGAAELLGFALRRLAYHRAGRRLAELFAGERRCLDELATGRGLDHWVGLWDKLAALAARVDAVNLDPLQALLQVVQAICATDPATELSIA